MRILLHIGSPKAGSSFLQSACARARSDLDAQGIHFPQGTPHDESCMRRGRISAGNALHLARFMRSGDWSEAQSWLDRAIQSARKRGCKTLLLSSEWLLGSAALPGRLRRLQQALQDQGATRVQFLLILRDPVSQLVSLYKHRAKFGAVPPLDQWVTDGYDLPQRLENLREQVAESRADLQVRAYGQNPGALEQIFFRDWLNVEVPNSSEHRLVNPSLSLSELVLLRRLRIHHPDLVPILYERLLAVAPDQKVESEAMRSFSQKVAQSAVAKHASEWRVWNALLPSGEQFEIPEACSLPDTEPDRLELSSEQLGAVMSLLADATGLQLHWRLFWSSRLRPFLARVKRLLFPWYSRR